MTPKIKSVIFSIDAETVGLYGEPFAVGYTVYNAQGVELESNYMSCPSKNAKGTLSDREWVEKNVVPHLPKEYDCETPQELCEKVYTTWMDLKRKYKDIITIADCGYPVESRLFSRAIENNEERTFTGPFPLHEVSTALMFAKIKREDYPRLPNELPEHHPLSDARQSARLFQTAFRKANID